MIRSNLRTLAHRLAVLATCSLITLPLQAQQTVEELTLERIHGSSDFSATAFEGRWMAGGEAWTEVEAQDEGTSLIRVEAASGQRTELIAPGELVPAGSSEAIEIEDYRFSSDERKILIFTDSEPVWRARTRGTYYVFDLANGDLRPLAAAPGGQMFAKFSPDGTRVAFVREHDLWLADLSTGEERRLTTDGSDDIINGTTDWVYEEELSLRDAFRWSPDGQRIAFWQLDQSAIDPFYLIDETKLYPELAPVRYPKAGTANSVARVGVIDLERGATTWFATGHADDAYIARMEWASSPTEVTIQVLNRHQNRLEVLLGDAETGETRPLLVESDSAWVDVHDDLTWFDDGRRFVWPSERDGWRHLYVYRRDGTLERQATRGEWDVTALDGVDDRRDRAYVTAAHTGPLGRSVLAVDLAGGGTRSLLEADRGTYGATFSPDYRRLVYSYSTIDTPPVWKLARIERSAVSNERTLIDNSELARRVAGLGLGDTEFIEVPAADGTPLNGYLIKPADFDANREYGVLMYVYGGPGSQTVRDQWGGSRHLWHHLLASNGVLVASVDNRGTGARGRDFKKQTYLRLGQLEAADQLSALGALGSRPYVDRSRIGIWGWSYGGYMTLLTTLLGEGEVAAGVSVAPVTGWELYDTIYTERFMRTPSENPEGYAEGAPLTHASRLDAELLIVHGTGDDNVHPQNTLQMVQALEEAGKQFDMRIYPNKRHGISGGSTRVNLFELITRFVVEHLGGPAEERAVS